GVGDLEVDVLLPTQILEVLRLLQGELFLGDAEPPLGAGTVGPEQPNLIRLSRPPSLLSPESVGSIGLERERGVRDPAAPRSERALGIATGDPARGGRQGEHTQSHPLPPLAPSGGLAYDVDRPLGEFASPDVETPFERGLGPR